MCCKNPLTLALDQLLAFFLVGPLVVGYWRSAFNIFDIYLLPGHSRTSIFISFGVGNIGMAIMPLFKWIFRQVVTKDQKYCSIRRVLGFNVYAYIAGFISVSHFRGGWKLLERHTGTSLTTELVTLGTAGVLLLLLRGFKNCTFVPYRVAMDLDPEVLEDKTRFNVPISSPIRYVLDNFLSTIIICNLVLAFWKGGWGVLNHLLYPGDTVASCVVSLVAVACSFLVMYPVQVILLQLQAPLRRSLLVRVLLDDAVFAVSNAGTILYWRAVWLLLDIYVLSRAPVLSNWATWAATVLGLGVLGACASCLTTGLDVDGDTLEEDTLVVYPNSFVRFYLERRGRSQPVPEKDGEEMTLLAAR